MIQRIPHPGKNNAPSVPLCISKGNGKQKSGSCSLLECQSHQSAVSRTHQEWQHPAEFLQASALANTLQKVVVPEDKGVSTPSPVPTSLVGPSSPGAPSHFPLLLIVAVSPFPFGLCWGPWTSPGPNEQSQDFSWSSFCWWMIPLHRKILLQTHTISLYLFFPFPFTCPSSNKGVTLIKINIKH